MTNIENIKVKEKVVDITGLDIIIGDKNIQIENELSGEDNANISVFTSLGDFNKIEQEKTDRINLINCNIKFNPRQPFVIRGILSFEKCKFEKDIEISRTKLKFSDIEKAYIEFKSQNSLLFKDTDLILELKEIKNSIEHIKNKEVSLTFSGGNITEINGHIASLNINSGSFNIRSSEECFINKFIFLNRLEIDNLKLSNGTIFKMNNNYQLELDFISLSQIIIKNFQLDLNVNNIDLYNTSIVFEGKSSLDMKKLESIATIWNPNKINYRGFCPSEKIDKNLTENKLLSAQEFFGEMKGYFSSKHNSIIAYYFYAAEMKAHRAYLKKKHPWYYSDNISSNFSFYSSDFSQDWQKALVWYVFLGSFVGLVFIVFSFFIKELTLNQDLVWIYYANIYSPASIRFDEITKLIKLPSWLIFLWMLWKIAAGYLIYQIIVSSRKFVRFK